MVCLLSEYLTAISLKDGVCSKHSRVPLATRKKPKFFQLQSRGPRPLLYGGSPLPALLLQLNSKSLGSNPVQRAEPCLHSTSSGDLLQGSVDCLCLSDSQPASLAFSRSKTQNHSTGTKEVAPEQDRAWPFLQLRYSLRLCQRRSFHLLPSAKRRSSGCLHPVHFLSRGKPPSSLS